MNKVNTVKLLAENIALAKDSFNEMFDKTMKEITLTPYQQFTAATFLTEDFNRLLLFWETGFGKTIFCTYIISNVFKIYPQWKIFIFVKSSLRKDPWEKELDRFLTPGIKQHIIFIHYDIPGTSDLLIHRLKVLLPVERCFFIFDESHDFIKKLIPKESGGFERRLTPLMKPLINQMNKGKNKVLFMSATPMSDNYKELLYMLYFLRPGAISLTQKIFSGDDLIEPALLAKVCLGVTSYQRRSEPDVFKRVLPTSNIAGKEIILHNIYMSEDQTNMYRVASNIELKSKARGFRTLRKLTNTFAFQELKIKGNMDLEDYEKQIKERMKDFSQSMSRISFSKDFIESFRNGSLTINEDSSLTRNLGLELTPVVSFNSRLRQQKKNVSQDIQNLSFLNSLSSKYIKTCQLILKAKGKCIVYQPFVSFEGVHTFLMYLEKFNISYIEYTQKTRADRSKLVKAFNEPTNNYGEEIKCCVISGAGKEGISMTCISDIIIMDIPWSGSEFEQIIGRGIRLNSHKDLPMEERDVKIHILINYTSSYPEFSVDREILDLLIVKEKRKMAVVKILEEGSIERSYNRYPDIQAIEYYDFFPIISQKYNVEELRGNVVSVIKELIDIRVSFDASYSNIQEVSWDDTTDRIYINGEDVGSLQLDDNGNPVFKIINSQLVYLALG